MPVDRAASPCASCGAYRALLGTYGEQVLEPKVPVKRAVFHEITQEALVKAFEVRLLLASCCGVASSGGGGVVWLSWLAPDKMVQKRTTNEDISL